MLDQSLRRSYSEGVAKYNIAMSWDPANGITMVMFFLRNLASLLASRSALWFKLLRSQLGRYSLWRCGLTCQKTTGQSVPQFLLCEVIQIVDHVES